MSDISDDLPALFSSAALIFVGSVFGSVSKIFERILIGRGLTESAYGDVSVGLSILTFSSMFALLGYHQGIPKYVSEFSKSKDIRGTWLSGAISSLAISVLLIVTIVAFSGTLSDYLFEHPDSTTLLILFALAIPFIVEVRVAISTIRGLENTRYRAFVWDLLYPVSRLIFIFTLLALGYQVQSVGIAYLLGSIIAFVASYVLLNKLILLTGDYDLRIKELTVFSLPLVASSILSLLLTRTDTVMLGYFKPSAQVGLYSAAFPLANGLVLVLASFGFLYLPLASRLGSEDDISSINKVYQLTTKWIFIITFPIFAVFVTFPEEVIHVAFGARYTDASLALVILAVGFFTNAAAGRNRETFTALGHPRLDLYTNLAAFLLNIALNLILIPNFGFVGAAISSAISFTTLNLIAYLLLNSMFGITPITPYSKRVFTVLPLLQLPVLFLISMRYHPGWIGLSLVLTMSAVFTLVLVLLIGGLESGDKILINSVESKLGIELRIFKMFLP